MDPYQNYQPGQNGFPPPGQGEPSDANWQNGPYHRQYQQPPRYQQPPQQQYEYRQPHPGKEKAKNAMIFGIIAVVAMFLGYAAVISVALGIVGLVMASKAKKMGYCGSEYTAAKVLSIVAIAGGSIAFIVTTAILVIGIMSWIDVFSFMLF